MFKCTVITQDGDKWSFMAMDIHDFCIRMYDYFTDKTDIFSVIVEREKKA